ncbi:MAG: hypothetical protein AB1467_05235 [Candidatus Diapherotrites archaeon]
MKWLRGIFLRLDLILSRRKYDKKKLLEQLELVRKKYPKKVSGILGANVWLRMRTAIKDYPLQVKELERLYFLLGIEKNALRKKELRDEIHRVELRILWCREEFKSFDDRIMKKFNAKKKEKDRFWFGR